MKRKLVENNSERSTPILAMALVLLVAGAGILSLTVTDYKLQGAGSNLLTGDAVNPPADSATQESNQSNIEQSPENKSENDNTEEASITRKAVVVDSVPADTGNETQNESEEEADSDSSGSSTGSDSTENTENSGSEPGIQIQKKVVFDASSSKGDDIESYRWEFGDGTTGSGEKVSHTYSPGSYEVKLTVTDAEGNIDNFSKTLTVKK